MAKLRIVLLGAPRVEVGGEAIPIRRRKALALLAFLAVTGRHHQREVLATLLWPEGEAGRAHAYLRNILWVLNQTAIGEWIDTTPQTLAFRHDARVWLDTRVFLERLAEGGAGAGVRGVIDAARVTPLAEAVGLYRGPFLSGFGLRDSAAFDEWQLARDEELRRALAGALERLVGFYAARREFEPAIAHTRRWLALDPLDERVQRELMTLYARSGQRTAALRLHRQAAERLRRELGVEPSPETHRLHRRIREGELDRRLPASLGPRPRHNLPAQTTAFIGRRRELAEIRRLLADPDCRLLTLVGLGGSGKTRLALQAAGEQVGGCADGVFFVPLAPVTEAGFLVPAILEALRVPLPRGRPGTTPGAGLPSAQLRRRLLAYLCEKQMLLLLDNLEHLPAASELVVEILRCAPGVTVLATSRERTGLHGEWVLEVEGLRCPAAVASARTLESYSATRLFLQGARRADLHYRPTGREASAVARICRLVDGIPLGVELAAAWVGTLPCQEIAREITANLDFLTARAGDLPARHQSMRAVFEQSWGLLPRDAQACFPKLAVFRGGFTRSAAEAVSGCCLPVLSALVAKSFLRRNRAGRYEMLEVLRQYAEERLADTPGVAARVRACHATHYLELLASRQKALEAGDQKAALAELAVEMENIRVAWRQAAEQGEVECLRRAMFGFFLYFDIRNRSSEAIEMLREVRATCAHRRRRGARPLVALGEVFEGWFLRFDDHRRSQALLRRGYDRLHVVGTPREKALAVVLGSIENLWKEGAQSRLRQAYRAFERAGDRWGAGVALEILAHGLLPGDPAGAETTGQQSLALRRETGDQWGTALALYVLGWIAECRGRFAEARERYQESVAIRRRLGEDPGGIVLCLLALGCSARRAGEETEAREAMQEALAAARAMGNRHLTAGALADLGLLYYTLGELTTARHYLEEALAVAAERLDPRLTVQPLATLGNLALSQGNLEEGRHHLQRGRAIQADHGWVLLGLGRLAGLAGKRRTAQRRLHKALRAMQAAFDRPGMLETLTEVARLKAAASDALPTARLLGVVQAATRLAPGAAQRAASLRTALRGRQPARELRTALAGGRRAMLEAVVAEELAGGVDRRARAGRSKGGR